MGLIPPAAEEIDRTARLLDDMATRLGPERPVSENQAKALAAWIGERVPIIWGSEGIAEAAATRWKTQMNENAKAPSFAGVLPELDHNEVEGWSKGSGTPFAAVMLRHRWEHPRIAPRVAATVDAVRPSGLEVREVRAEGFGRMEALFSLIMLGDFASAYLGVLRGEDPLAIPVLTSLKERLPP
jgi:glucose/mannose-6-phosphate isomerase